MATWNTAYELNPQNFKNPGAGAFHFRDLKIAIRERDEREHFWGDDEDGVAKGWYGGVHKEGSAKISVDDGGYAGRGGQISPTSQIGQVVADMELLGSGSYRKQDGVNLQDLAAYDYTDQLERIVRIVGAEFDGLGGIWSDPSNPLASEVFTLFDYNQMVDIHQDQDINGIKRFQLSPQIPALGDWQDYLDTLPTTDPTGLAGVNVTEAQANVSDAKTFNIFDTELLDNEPTRVADINSPTGYVMPQNIQAAEIYGQKVRGAVWSS